MVDRIWPTAAAGKADSVSFVSASACHIGGPNSVNPGQILLEYGNLQIITTRLVNICIKGAKKLEKNKDLSVSINEVWKVV